MRLMPVVIVQHELIFPIKIVKYVPNFVTRLSPFLSIFSIIISISLFLLFICKYKLIMKKLY